MKLRTKLIAAAAWLVASLPAQATEYVMSVSADFSGPFANVMPNAMSGLKSITDWWNEEVGKRLGVSVKLSIHDMRYDAAVIARTWPAILRSEKPIMHLGFGSPDLTTLMRRLPNDKVPMLIGTAMVGLVWSENGWHYSIRPTYSHEFAGLLARMQQEKGRTLRIASISTQNQAGFVDQVNGLRHLAKTYPDRFEMLETQWADTAPVSLSSSVRAIVGQNADVIIVGGTTAQVQATASALKELGARIPVITSTHNGLTEAAKGTALVDMDGFYSAFSFAAPGQESLPLRDVYNRYRKEGNWGMISAQSAAQALLALRVLERAVAKVGRDNVTGEAMRQALLDNVFTEQELLGALPTLDFDESAPFPVGRIRATAEVVRGGQIVPLGTGWIDVPALTKW
ncbi:MAG: ABC transporter substrate-binding protein [Methylobacterium sp.]|nr:ABC transporter substrate-binding protein [Methylobacterium sp.]MCA3672573.1 ABC transporter substrate-binding protein [Methylobacterium sp.]MCA3676705.1 ABC transporter substrate-binding protein [Methylobacterium sp.]MCA3681141.1 ABC transporter substrate-binding protein [Methylobacterium sp.]MCA3682755.1 ABC transporter substrate-binding protein [Methylobacterium sp.]